MKEEEEKKRPVLACEYLHSEEERKKDLLGGGRLINLDGFTLGDVIIDNDGQPREFVCGFCGNPFESSIGEHHSGLYPEYRLARIRAYHMKPENYRFRYRGITFYLEVHLCEPCKQKHFPKVKVHLHAKDPIAPSKYE